MPFCKPRVRVRCYRARQRTIVSAQGRSNRPWRDVRILRAIYPCWVFTQVLPITTTTTGSQQAQNISRLSLHTRLGSPRYTFVAFGWHFSIDSDEASMG